MVAYSCEVRLMFTVNILRARRERKLKKLLRDALYVLNMTPNMKLPDSDFKDSYKLAAAIQRELLHPKEIKK